MLTKSFATEHRDKIEHTKSSSKRLHHGDTRADGYRFWGYHPGCTNGESWYSPKQWERAKAKRKPAGPPQVNCKTVPSPKFGDLREDGYRFHGCDKKKGHELWYSPKAWQRAHPGEPRFPVPEHHKRVRNTYHNLKKRAKAEGLEFDLTYEFLLETFPPSGLCRVTGEPMVWGKADRIWNSPSVDRLDSAKGYTQDKVWWISHKANRDKAEMDKLFPDVAQKRAAAALTGVPL